MNLDRYPAQEPLSPLGTAYQQQVLERGAGVSGERAQYGDDPYQSLTVFRPASAEGSVLLFFHGGGWTNGYQEWMYFMAPALLEHGVTFVTAGYRLAPAHLFPTGLDDCARAANWVFAQIGRYSADPARLFIGGHSAGGHYAALLAVTSQWRGGTPKLRGCLPVSGVYRFGEGSGLAMRPRFLGPAQTAQHAEREASPMLRIEPAGCPPFLLSWGSGDFPHLIEQAKQMRRALERANVPVETFELEGCDHFQASLACGATGGAWPARAAQWMHRTVA